MTERCGSDSPEVLDRPGPAWEYPGLGRCTDNLSKESHRRGDHLSRLMPPLGDPSHVVYSIRRATAPCPPLVVAGRPFPDVGGAVCAVLDRAGGDPGEPRSLARRWAIQRDRRMARRRHRLAAPPWQEAKIVLPRDNRTIIVPGFGTYHGIELSTSRRLPLGEPGHASPARRTFRRTDAVVRSRCRDTVHTGISCRSRSSTAGAIVFASTTDRGRPGDRA